MTDAQAAPVRMCSICHGIIFAGQASRWVFDTECHSDCYPSRPIDSAVMPARQLTEADVRRIVREELAKEQR